ncbi:MAG: helix-hairpin-helix domain-containing protein [Bacteroidales bacterium]|nr:helix-hairpin-helix domain-containing protein [Bacteroidales bacterium]
MRKLLTILSFMIMPILASAQNNRENADDIIREILEYAAEADNDISNSLARISSEYLTNLANYKLNINTCSFADLQNIPFLTDYQIEEILNYRVSYGQFYTLGELKGLETLTEKEVRFLQFFLYVGDQTYVNNQDQKLSLREGTNSITTTTKYIFEKQDGYSPDSTGQKAFLGNPLAWCIKYRYTLKNKIAWGFTSEVDPGESLSFGHKRYGFDFNSAFFRMQNYRHLEKLVLGDYIVKFGEGLLFSGGFSMGKFFSSANYAATENTLREYSSTDENWFYRGIAACLIFNRLKITALVSHNKMDASSTDTTFSCFKVDGYHRTESELKNKDAILQDIASVHLSYHFGQLKFSLASQYYHYNKTYLPGDMLKFANTTELKDGFSYSVAYRYSSRKYCFHGETALDNALNLATINIMEVKPVNSLKFSFLYRNYSQHYNVLTANTFSENTKVGNEEGFYFGTAIEPNKYLVFEGWIDIFKFPWLTTNTKMPTTGYDYFTQLTFIISKKYSIFLRYKCKEKQLSEGPVDFKRTQYARFTNKFSPNKNVTFTTVAQWSFYKDESVRNRGYLMYQNVQLKIRKRPFIFAFRYAIFSAPYDARIYAYENDVMYFFSAPAYYNKGARYYAVAGYNFGKRATLQFRLSRWQYFDRESLSSGKSFIDESHKTELNMFFRISI